MKMKKRTVIALTALLMCLTACGQSDSNNSEESESVQTTKATETTADENNDNKDIDLSESEQTISETENDVSSAAEPVTEEEEFVPIEGLSEKYGDFDNRSFAYDGKVYVLGESTLKDLIDGGVPFKENDLNNRGNNVNSNYETDTYGIEINDFVSMQVKFVNTTNEAKKAEDCLLSYVRLYTIYVPHPDYEESLNEEIRTNIADASKHVCFSFPLTLTKEQLLENNSESTETGDNYVNYYIDSEVYMASSGYHFGFNIDVDQLENVSISWLP